MATLAPPPYRPSPSRLASATSTANSATPSRKQENSAAVAAGRRRLDEFKRKRAADKSKKTPAAAIPSDELAPNVTEREQHAILPTSGDPPLSPSRPLKSNGHVSRAVIEDGINVVSTEPSSSPKVGVAAEVHREHTSVSPPLSRDHRGTGELMEKDPHLTTVSRGSSSNDGNSTVGLDSCAVEQSIIANNAGSFLIKADAGAQAGSLSGLKLTNTTGTGMPIPPLSATSPLFVPALLPCHQENLGLLKSASGHEKLEPMKNIGGVNPSPISKSSPSAKGFQSSLNLLNQKVSCGDLVALDSKIVPSKGAQDELFLPSLSEPDQESISSGKSHGLISHERLVTDNKIDGISTSAANVFSQSSKAGSLNMKSCQKGSLNPKLNSLSSTLPLLLDTKPSLKVSSETSALLHPPFTDATAPKHLPLHPPLLQPPIHSSSFKPEPFLSPGFGSISDSGSSSSTLFSSLTATNFHDNALLWASAPLTFKSPGPVAIMVPHENDKPEVSKDLFSSLLPRLPSAFGEAPTSRIKGAEAMNKSQKLWLPPSSGGDDFAMLEQYIQELTQDKFSLQRGLDAARALVDTLAQENSAFTEHYNNQGAFLNDLEAETERQQGEIRAQAVLVKEMKAERDKAVQITNAAVERSQALAAEVIGLEEKVLQARSQELKLQREMELLGAETESQKRQILSLDKDRANLNTLIEALQEEKGLLQTQIRKAFAGGSSGDSRHPNKPSSTAGVYAKVDAGTSTHDFELGTFVAHGQGLTTASYSTSDNPLVQSQLMEFQPLEQWHRLPMIVPSAPSRPLLSPSHATQASGSFSPPNQGGVVGPSFSAVLSTSSGCGLHLGSISSVIPPDHTVTIGNINALITELVEEKTVLLKTLRAESVGAAELRVLNSELSRKLEVQTQRLELAVAQSMAHGSTPRIGTNYAVSHMTPEYVDEGDEVVDRVLGWIMQLLPSGSSRRKHL